jgi:hypothetical protein
MPHDDEMLTALCRDLGLQLDHYNFQFLWLMPIIEVMWADGRCQKEEIETLFHYAGLFVKLVNHDVPEITVERAKRFFLPLLEPSAISNPRKQALLARLVDQIIQDVVEPAHRDKRSHLFHICAEVAAAARADDEIDPKRRFSEEEGRLLKNLFRDLRLGGNDR